MTKETILKLHSHFKKLAEGNFTEADLSKEYGEGGSMTKGKLTPESKLLIKSDATRQLTRLEAKFDFLTTTKKKV